MGCSTRTPSLREAIFAISGYLANIALPFWKSPSSLLASSRHTPPTALPTPAPQLGLRAGGAIIPPTSAQQLPGLGPTAIPGASPAHQHTTQQPWPCQNRRVHSRDISTSFSSFSEVCLWTKKKKPPAEKELGKTVICNLSDEDFKVVVIKMLAELRRKIDKHSENFSREKI